MLRVANRVNQLAPDDTTKEQVYHIQLEVTVLVLNLARQESLELVG